MTAPEPILDLPSPEDWVTITGRGDVAYFGRGLVEWPRRLVNRKVRIEGTTYTVKGVEMFAVPDDHPVIHWGSFGLMMAEPRAERKP